jgi:hypothetical protein
MDKPSLASASNDPAAKEATMASNQSKSSSVTEFVLQLRYGPADSRLRNV